MDHQIKERFLGCGYCVGQAFYGTVCGLLGLVFSNVHQLHETPQSTFRVFWPLPVLMFILTAILSLATHMSSSNYPSPHKKCILVYVIPCATALLTIIILIINGSANLVLAGIILAYSVMQVTFIWLYRHPNCLYLNTITISEDSMRYALVLPMMLVVILNMAMGVLAPLALQGSILSILFMLLLTIYLTFWYLTRELGPDKYGSVHFAFFAILFAFGIVVFIIYYLIGHKIEDQLIMPTKGIFMALSTGIYLSIPKAYLKTWRQRDYCTLHNFRKRIKILGTLISCYDCIVYLTFIWLKFSTVYIVLFAMGSTVFSILVTKDYHGLGIGCYTFIGATVTVLFIEYSNLMPVWAYKLPGANPELLTFVIGALFELAIPSVIEIVWHAVKKKKKTESNDTARCSPVFCQKMYITQSIVLFAIQVLILSISGIFGYNPRIQVAFFSSFAALTLHMLWRLVCLVMDESVKEKKTKND